MKNTMFYISWAVNLLLGFVGLGIHLYSVYILYQIKGLFGAIIGLIMPIVSQIYLVILSWGISETFLNNYTILVLSYVVSFVVLKVIIIATMPKE